MAQQIYLPVPVFESGSKPGLHFTSQKAGSTFLDAVNDSPEFLQNCELLLTTMPAGNLVFVHSFAAQPDIRACIVVGLHCVVRLLQ